MLKTNMQCWFIPEGESESRKGYLLGFFNKTKIDDNTPTSPIALSGSINATGSAECTVTMTGSQTLNGTIKLPETYIVAVCVEVSTGTVYEDVLPSNVKIIRQADGHEDVNISNDRL